VSYSALLCVTVHRGVLQCVAVCVSFRVPSVISLLGSTCVSIYMSNIAWCSHVLQYVEYVVAVCCIVLQGVAVRVSFSVPSFICLLEPSCIYIRIKCCIVLQCVAVCWICVAACCIVLQGAVVCMSFRVPFSISLLESTCVYTHIKCCSVLQCVAVCCSVLQCVAVCCSVHGLSSALLHLPTRIHLYLFTSQMMQCIAERHSVLQCVAVRYRMQQVGAACLSFRVPSSISLLGSTCIYVHTRHDEDPPTQINLIESKLSSDCPVSNLF